MDNATTAYLTPDITKRAEAILHVFSMVFYSVAFLLGTIGNGLVIWFSVFRMKKTVNVVWFLNLAIADFICSFFLPLRVTYIALDFHWPFGTLICKLNTTVAVLSLFASIFLLSVISIDRCISVMFPVWCQNHRTPRLASIVVLFVWILALIFSLPSFIFRDTKKSPNWNLVCFNNFSHDSDFKILIHRGNVVTLFIIGFAIPFIIIVSCYTVIMLRIYKNHITTATRPFKIIVAVIISFFVCWFPFHVFSFLELNTHHTDLSDVLHVGIPLATSLAFLNSCVNPFLYVFIGHNFKERFWTSFQNIFERAFTEDSLPAHLQSKTKSNFQMI